jgi:hypothetical protein
MQEPCIFNKPVYLEKIVLTEDTIIVQTREKYNIYIELTKVHHTTASWKPTTIETDVITPYIIDPQILDDGDKCTKYSQKYDNRIYSKYKYVRDSVFFTDTRSNDRSDNDDYIKKLYVEKNQKYRREGFSNIIICLELYSGEIVHFGYERKITSGDCFLKITIDTQSKVYEF